MPTRRSYLATLCSGTLLLAGCSAIEDDEETQTPVETPETDPEDESDVPSRDETPTDEGAAVPETEPSEDDYLDIRDFGADVDGRTDDSAALQNAIHSAAAGETVLVPEGTTLVSTDGGEQDCAIDLDAEEVPPDLTITGRGKQSKIKLADDQQGGILLRFSGDDSFDNLLVSQLRIDGNATNQSENGGHGIRVNNSTDTFTPANIRFQHLWVEDCTQTGISLWRGGITADHITVRGCAKHGISIGEAGSRSTDVPTVFVSRSLFEQNGRNGTGNTYGINCSGGNVFVSNCVVRDNAQGTKTTDDSIETTYNRVRLENNDYHGYIRAGEDVNTRSKVTFDKVVARGNGRAGFRLSRDTDYVVPSQILARANNDDNIIITNNASIEADTIWSNNAESAYGLTCDSDIGGEIRNYRPYGNGNGPFDLNDQLEIIETDRQNKMDIQTVPKAEQVGAGSTWLPTGEFTESVR